MKSRITGDGKTLFFADTRGPDIIFDGAPSGLWVQVDQSDNCIPWSEIETLIDYLRTVRARSTQ